MTDYKKRILVVDDETTICQLCQRVLTADGFEVDTVYDSTVARSMIVKREYDLYLFDIKMPVTSGRQLYEWLQKTYPDWASRVLFITGSSIGKETEGFLQGTGRPVLFKPFTTDELKEKVASELQD